MNQVNEGITSKTFILNLWRSFTHLKAMHLFMLKTATGIGFETETHRNFLTKIQRCQTYGFCSVFEKSQTISIRAAEFLQAPSKDSKIKVFLVLSESTNIPNYVQVHGNGKVTCTCKQFPPKKICAHSIAVAEKDNMLKQFIDWLLKTNCLSNISLTATMNLNACRSGRKGGIDWPTLKTTAG